MDVEKINIIFRALNRLGTHISERTKKDGFYDYIAHSENDDGDPTFRLVIADSETGKEFGNVLFDENNFENTFYDNYKKFACKFNMQIDGCLNEWTNKPWTKLPMIGKDSWKRMFHEVYEKQEIKINNNLLLVL